jgi:hypothetical protein
MRKKCISALARPRIPRCGRTTGCDLVARRLGRALAMATADCLARRNRRSFARRKEETNTASRRGGWDHRIRHVEASISSRPIPLRRHFARRTSDRSEPVRLLATYGLARAACLNRSFAGRSCSSPVRDSTPGVSVVHLQAHQQRTHRRPAGGELLLTPRIRLRFRKRRAVRMSAFRFSCAWASRTPRRPRPR